MKKYKKLLLAVATIASLYLVKVTGLDQGLIDGVLEAVVEVVVEEEPVQEVTD